MLEHRLPLEQVAGARAGAVVEAPGLRVTPVTQRGLLLLQAHAGSAALAAAVRDEVGLALPQPLQAAGGGEAALLWIAPRQFLLELAAARVAPVQAALAARLGTSLAAVTAMSDAYAAFDVDGPAAAEALMTGCTLDLRAHAFPPGRVARTAFAGVAAILWRSADPGRFRCLVDRSHALHVRDWLAQAP